MSKQTINLGTSPTGAGGDDVRGAFTKTNANFDELYAGFGGTIPSDSAAAYPLIGSATAVFQRGSNANGEYVRFQDGTQLCWGILRSGTIAANTAPGIVQITLPIAFLNKLYTPTATATPVSSWDFYGVLGSSRISTTVCQIHVRSGPVAQAYDIQWLCVGRWK